MKTFIVLAFFAVAALAVPPRHISEPTPSYYTVPTVDYPTKHEPGYRFEEPKPEQLKPQGEEYVRICVPHSCEMKKCQRLASELTYKVEPRKEWSCIQATSQEHCLQWVKRGHADVVVVRGDDIHKAVKKYDLKPLAHEVPSIPDKLKGLVTEEKAKKYEKISLAVVHKDSSIGRITDLKGVPSCHAGIQHPASFKTPICSLIEEGLIPKSGNHLESAADFFKKSCVPGVLDPRVDRNGTNPAQLVEICGSEGKKKGSFVDVYSDNEGASKCLRDRKGEVAFLDHTYIEEFKEHYGSQEYKLVCKQGVVDLEDWTSRSDCHLGHVPQPTLFTRKNKMARWQAVSKYLEHYGKNSEELSLEEITTPIPTNDYSIELKQKEQDYDNKIVEILKNAVVKFQTQEPFKLFSSDEYKCDEQKIKLERKQHTLKRFEQILGFKITSQIRYEEQKQDEAISVVRPLGGLRRERRPLRGERDEDRHPQEPRYKNNYHQEQPRHQYQEPETRKNLIFLDTSSSIEKIEEEIQYYFEEYMRSSDKCSKLQSKPRAKFCVTSEKEYEKCLKMKEYFSKVDKVKDVAWGCERAHSKLECMKKVYEGHVDLISLNPEETFIAGRELLLQPIMSEFHEVFEREIENGKKHYDDETKTTKTYTVGIIKKDRYIELFNKKHPIDGHKDWENKSIDLKKVKTCLAGISKISGFKHPIGHLMANGTIPRIGSIFESIQKHFERTCLPGAKHFTVEKDLILGHEFNWGHNTTHFANFTGHDFYIWNSPYTWSYYDLQKRTPQFMESFFKLPELLKSLEQIDLPEELKQKIELLREGKEHKYHGGHQTPYTPYTEEESEDEVIKHFIEVLRTIEQSPISQWEKDQETQRIQKQIQKRIQEKRQESWYEALLGSDPVEYKKIEKFLKQYDMPALQHIKMTLETAIPKHLKKAVPQLTHLFKIIPEKHLDKTEKVYLQHPAVQHFLQVYYPTLVKQLLKAVGDEFQHDEHNRYTSPIWLSPEYKEFLNKMRLHGEKLSESCEGSGDENKHTERFTDTIGALKCLEEKKGDVTFMPSHQLEEFSRHFHGEIRDRQPQDYALICPCGTVIPYINTESIKKCNFGKVPYHAIMTDSKRTGTYRWTITKALLHAQRYFSHHSNSEFEFKMFGEDSVFDKETSKLYPVPLVNQTFEVHLGSQLLRSLEALVKPSSTHTFEQHKQLCYGQQFSNVIYQHNETCRAVVKTVTCSGEPRNHTIHLNKHGEKVSIKLEMISRPSRYSRKMVEFTCDTGYSYLKPVVIPEDCECVPKDEIVVSPEWNHDHVWYTEERKYHRSSNPLHKEDEKLEKKLWGNKQQWVERKETPNFFKEPETREQYYSHYPHGQRVVQYNRHHFDTPHYWKKTYQVCEKRHHFNNTFELEKHDLTRPVCPSHYEEEHHHHHDPEHVYHVEEHNEEIYSQEVHEQKYQTRHQEERHQDENTLSSIFSWLF